VRSAREGGSKIKEQRAESRAVEVGVGSRGKRIQKPSQKTTGEL
jgi:hypothetical protein